MSVLTPPVQAQATTVQHYCLDGGGGGALHLWTQDATDCSLWGWQATTAAGFDSWRSSHPSAQTIRCVYGNPITRAYEVFYMGAIDCGTPGFRPATSTEWDGFATSGGGGEDPGDGGDGGDGGSGGTNPPSGCPTAPAAYEGTDELVAELRELRREEAATCAALAGRLDVVNTSTSNVRAAVETARTSIDATTAAVDGLDAPLLRLADGLAPSGEPALYGKLAVLPAKADAIEAGTVAIVDAIEAQGPNPGAFEAPATQRVELTAQERELFRADQAGIVFALMLVAGCVIGTRIAVQLWRGFTNR